MLSPSLRRHTRKACFIPGLILASLSAAGCTQMLADSVVSSPNQNEAVSVSDAGMAFFGASSALRIPVGPPDAMLSAWVYEPTATPRGTILVLHGILSDKLFMAGYGRSLRDAGYRAVCVDLRGHGNSTGDYLTYGVQESKDLSKLLDALDTRHLLTGPVGALGFSYGAATAIELAGRDPRITALVAVAPFSSMRDEVPNFARHILPIPGIFLSDSDLTSIVDDAGKIAQFNPDEASPLLAAQATRRSILILHGDWDYVIPIEQSRKIQAAAPDHVTLSVLHAHGHITSWADPTGTVTRQTLAWFAASMPR